MPRKFIPNGDLDFVTMAEHFARTIAEEPGRFEVTPEESGALSAAVAVYRAAFQGARCGERSMAATRAKDEARAVVEPIIRRIGHLVRSNPRISGAEKLLLGIRPRAEKPKILSCPQEPPRLRFLRALHEGNGATPVHELSFHAYDLSSRAKPAGAVRLELFVDLVPPDEPIPTHPGENQGSRPWYLRSYTRSPIRLTPPIARVPMRVIYWGRWADSMGNVGPFSATAAAWIEGGSHRYLPGGTGAELCRKPIPLLDEAPAAGPAGRDPAYSVAVLEVRYSSTNGRDVAQALPEVVRREMARLEGPAKEEAA